MGERDAVVVVADFGLLVLVLFAARVVAAAEDVAGVTNDILLWL